MKIIGIIPARYSSTRFPGKPLVDIGGRSMVMRVFDQASKVAAISKVIVATDDQRIFDHVYENGGTAVMTRDDHPSGTDRCNEAISGIEERFDFAINIQGDEPFLKPEQINSLCQVLTPEVEIGSMMKKISDEKDLFNPNVVKVVVSEPGNALYFSRQTIPYQRNAEKENWLENFSYFKHLGIYAYRTDILSKLAALPEGKLEKAESLEQLRWLEKGYSIKMVETDIESIGIDTPEDLELVKKKLNL
ncbi:3-deoxy-manno-octulosonate cytidylyltransferase [Marinigracilibium pacificum]|uniref:3-deoxy-manno-octulosonate cytidylyltransferase n=1 Tax=Marinigracilibium pacificum TaxID=2729599 RepID=A0A848J479_9BACT|nr:3-deoxy-manno-octulosonate cytidylyltransferase [Marinigracilibium pacificum]NMM50541.1 3-deoxy-manno-octulosonate cytidylyltransferase [Marinigracilibium pacificum]